MPRQDPYRQKLNSDPVSNAVVLTVDDANDLPFTTSCVHFPTTGTFRCVMEGGQTINWPALAGDRPPLRIVRVLTGTTMTDAIGMW